MQKTSLFLCAISSLSLYSLSNAANNRTIAPQTYKEMIACSQKLIDQSSDNITTVLHTTPLPFETKATYINDFLKIQRDIISLRKNPPIDPETLPQKLSTLSNLLHECFINILIQEQVTKDTDDCSNEVFKDEKPLLKKTNTELIQLYKEQIASLMEGDRFKKKYPDATEREKREYQDFSCQRLLKGQVSNNLQRKKRTKRKKA